jgi:hypothetical protein
MSLRENRRGLDRLLRFMRAKQGIRVGILSKGSQTEENGFKVADLAATHEFGLGNAIERPFIRGWYDANHTKLFNMATQRFQQGAIAGADPAQISGQLAVFFAADCQNRMVSGWTYPDISQETKDRKGSSTPLIDTSLMQTAIAGEAYSK